MIQKKTQNAIDGRSFRTSTSNFFLLLGFTGTHTENFQNDHYSISMWQLSYPRPTEIFFVNCVIFGVRPYKVNIVISVPIHTQKIIFSMSCSPVLR